MTLDPSDHAVLAALLGIALGIVRILEALVEWAAKKMTGHKLSNGGNPSANGHTMMVTLDPESSRMLRETYERTSRALDVIERRDTDGVPLVYMPRSYGETQHKTLELVRDCSQSQERLCANLERLSDKTDVVIDMVNDVAEEVKIKKAKG